MALAYCNFYHREIKLLGHVPGDEPIVRKLCQPCRERLEREVDAYVHELAHRKKKSAWTPHQGPRERARRVRQMQKTTSI